MRLLQRIASWISGGFCLLCLGGCETGTDNTSGVDHSGKQSLRIGGLLGGPTADFARATNVRAFTFPADHGPHDDYRSEWWYLTLILRDPRVRSRRFGGQFTLFRQAAGGPPIVPDTDNPWRSRQFFMAHVALTDVRDQQHFAAERFARGHPALAGVRAEPFAAWLDGWRLESQSVDAAGFLPLRLDVATQKFEWQLTVSANPNFDKGIVLQGNRGLSQKGQGQASYYYSMPRLSVEGTVRIAGQNTPVVGTGWLDREWSTSVLGDDLIGWDWFALGFDDGADAMMFRLRRRDGQRDRFDSGVWITAGHQTRSLGLKDFELQPLAFWRDLEGNRWPIAWRIRVGNRRIIAKAAVEDQLMRLSVRYWEGLVDLFEEAPDGGSGKQIGAGYMELTGYEQ